VSVAPCMRCGRLAATQVYGAGLWLCGSCTVREPCGPFQHAYRARDGVGTWVCTHCGGTLSSQPIATAVVPADQPPPDASLS